MRTASLGSILVVWFGLVVLRASPADDWPQWLGPQRDSVWREAGIVDRLRMHVLDPTPDRRSEDAAGN